MPRILTQAHVDQFRNRLCDVAARLYFEMGHGDFNMRDLASRVGVSAMTPYRYFRDKDEILSAIRTRAFNRFAARLELAMAEPGTASQKSEAVTKAYIDFALEHSCCYRLMFDLSHPGIESSSELLAAERRARGALTGHIRLMEREGLFHGDPELIGSVLWSGLHGVVTLHLSGALADDEFEQTLDEVTRVLSGAYRRRQKPELEIPL